MGDVVPPVAVCRVVGVTHARRARRERGSAGAGGRGDEQGEEGAVAVAVRMWLFMLGRPRGAAGGWR